MERIQEAADKLAWLRQTHTVEDGLPESCRPADLAQGYAVQEALLERLMAQRGGVRLGYKVAATSRRAQELLGVDGPFYGGLLSASTVAPPARLAAADFVHCLVEPEFAVEIAADVPVAAEPYTAVTIAPFVRALLPAIEIVDWRFTDWAAVGAPSLAADNAIHGAWIPGAPVENWQTLGDLAAHGVDLNVNGALAHQGRGAAVLGHPMNVLAWLANELPQQGRGLKAGDRVTTGVCTEPYLAQPGDRIEADFGVLGRVEMVFE